ncbi:hypothetical protein PCYB_031050 [Plasmodium cynomolgi strain B]|uniref:Uncharacterized protein n=1 Tax=Plasmodium cynomolgi (strain B) TaxID=1120755 RepID=K6V6G0_PLACD|nr:hypothetical protein PCYB_031050 [Plasmodium cynomolgi strain B]GAB64692.1 hypothetical protein PCYB_031050 [Plasmodium cynomolgi strain B]
MKKLIPYDTVSYVNFVYNKTKAWNDLIKRNRDKWRDYLSDEIRNYLLGKRGMIMNIERETPFDESKSWQGSSNTEMKGGGYSRLGSEMESNFSLYDSRSELSLDDIRSHLGLDELGTEADSTWSYWGSQLGLDDVKLKLGSELGFRFSLDDSRSEFGSNFSMDNSRPEEVSTFSHSDSKSKLGSNL